MRRALLALLPVLLILGLPGMAHAAFLPTWASLDPGDDWAADIIRSVFPIGGAATGGFATGTAATVIGVILGNLTGFVSAIAMAFLCYATIMQIHRVAETGQALTNAMTSMAVVRLGVAAVLMFPLASGFNLGQQLVVNVSLWGVGMARTVYDSAIKGIGPDGMVIADPIIPGTKTIVANLIRNELCRSLVNAASAQSGLVPAPTPITVADATSGGYMTWSYSLSAGNDVGSPACGSITIRQPKSRGTTISGVSVDMTAMQQAVLTSVLASIRPDIDTIAQTFWATKQAAALVGLQSILQSAVTSYTSQLTSKASAKTAELRTAFADATNARAGGVGLTTDEVVLSSLGWASAGAYYLEFARLNGQTLSLMSAVPEVNTPSYEGLGTSLATDLAPLIRSSDAYLTKLMTYVQTTDGLDTPGGNAELFSGATPGEDGSSTIEQVFRKIRLDDRVLNLLIDNMAPTGSNWTDPFSALIQLGHKMVVLAISAMGLASIASSGTATTAITAWNLLTLNGAGAAATIATHLIVNFLATPLFMVLSAILIPGLMLAFVLPMIPWAMWLAGVVGWLILVCEAVIAVPLWMLAHMTYQGDGLHGRASEGYSLLFNVLFRPTLMLLGLFLAYFVFGATSWLIRQSFGIAAGFVLANGWLVTNVLGVVVLLAIFVLTHLTAALMSFRLITLVPHHLPRMVGFSSANRVDMEQFGRDAAFIGVNRTLHTVERGMLGGASSGNAGQSGAVTRLAGPGAASRSDGMDSTLRAATDMPTASNRET